MALTLAEANKVVEGAIAAATEMGIKINVAVVDAGGRLLAFNRMDGAIWPGWSGLNRQGCSQRGLWPLHGELQERAETPIIRGILAAGGGMDPSQGGLPIIRNGVVEGAVGVGGGTGQQDETALRLELPACSAPEGTNETRSSWDCCRMNGIFVELSVSGLSVLWISNGSWEEAVLAGFLNQTSRFLKLSPQYADVSITCAKQHQQLWNRANYKRALSSHVEPNLRIPRRSSLSRNA